MKFDCFRQAEFRRPTDIVPVPALKAWLFEDNEQPELLVQGLGYNDQQLAREQLRQNSIITALRAAIGKAAAGNAAELQALITHLLGGSLDNRVAAETAYRIEVVLRGVIDATQATKRPLFTRQDVVRLAQHFPLEFHALSERILELSGDPSILGEHSNGTGRITPSATH